MKEKYLERAANARRQAKINVCGSRIYFVLALVNAFVGGWQLVTSRPPMNFVFVVVMLVCVWFARRAIRDYRETAETYESLARRY